MGQRGSRSTLQQPLLLPLGRPGWTQRWVRDFSGHRQLGPSQAGRERAEARAQHLPGSTPGTRGPQDTRLPHA